MWPLRQILIPSLVLLTLLPLPSSALGQSPEYAIRRLSLAGNDGYGGTGIDVNEIGDVVGTSIPEYSTHPFTWIAGEMVGEQAWPGVG